MKLSKQRSCGAQEYGTRRAGASDPAPAWRMQAPCKASLLLLLSQNCFKFKIEKTFMCGSI